MQRALLLEQALRRSPALVERSRQRLHGGLRLCVLAFERPQRERELLEIRRGALGFQRIAALIALQQLAVEIIDPRALDLGRLRLVDDERVEQLRGEHAVVERAAAIDARAERRAGGARHRLHAVEPCAAEIAAQAADGDVAALAGVALDRDAGDALERIGEVGVGEGGDVLRVDRIDHFVRFALGLDRRGEALAEAGDDDVLSGAACGGLRVRRRRLRRRSGRCLVLRISDGGEGEGGGNRDGGRTKMAVQAGSTKSGQGRLPS